MVPYLKDLVATGIRVWLFNGDFYAMVPVTATKRSVEKLHLPVVADWRPWSTAQGGDVAGYVVEYKGLVFATVRGAGSMVPVDGALHQFPPGRTAAALRAADQRLKSCVVYCFSVFVLQISHQQF